MIKAYGEKTNVWFSPECKSKGNLISLAMIQTRSRDIWQDAHSLVGECVKEGAAGHDENLNGCRLESGVSVQWMIPEAIEKKALTRFVVGFIIVTGIHPGRRGENQVF